MPDTEACRSCRFWKFIGQVRDKGDRLDYAVGSCLRHAPRPGRYAEGDPVWPETFSDDWCGEWQPLGG